MVHALAWCGIGLTIAASSALCFMIAFGTVTWAAGEWRKLRGNQPASPRTPVRGADDLNVRGRL